MVVRLSRSQGFTLIEVLVALFIVSMTLAAGMRALSGAVRVSQAVPEHRVAQWSADNQLVLLVLQRDWPPLGKTTVSCPQGEFDFKCHQLVLESPNPFFREVVITVTYLGSDQELARASTLVVNQTAHVL